MWGADRGVGRAHSNGQGVSGEIASQGAGGIDGNGPSMRQAGKRGANRLTGRVRMEKAPWHVARGLSRAEGRGSRGGVRLARPFAVGHDADVLRAVRHWHIGVYARQPSQDGDG